MGEFNERRLRAQLGVLEADRDRARREIEVKAAESRSLGRAVAQLDAEKRALQHQLDQTREELRRVLAEKSVFVARSLPAGRAKEAVVMMGPEEPPCAR